jgi:hypothetical protein
MKRFKAGLFFLIALFTIFSPIRAVVLADTGLVSDINRQLDAGGSNTGLNGQTDFRDTIALIIRSVLGLLGVIALALIVYAGFLWMTAGGNSEQVGSAKSVLINSVIGLVIILSAYAITYAVFDILLAGTSP